MNNCLCWAFYGTDLCCPSSIMASIRGSEHLKAKKKKTLFLYSLPPTSIFWHSAGYEKIIVRAYSCAFVDPTCQDIACMLHHPLTVALRLFIFDQLARHLLFSWYSMALRSYFRLARRPNLRKSLKTWEHPWMQSTLDIDGAVVKVLSLCLLFVLWVWSFYLELGAQSFYLELGAPAIKNLFSSNVQDTYSWSWAIRHVSWKVGRSGIDVWSCWHPRQQCRSCAARSGGHFPAELGKENHGDQPVRPNRLDQDSATKWGCWSEICQSSLLSQFFLIFMHSKTQMNDISADTGANLQVSGLKCRNLKSGGEGELCKIWLPQQEHCSKKNFLLICLFIRILLPR